jgi:hypothetical protein
VDGTHLRKVRDIKGTQQTQNHCIILRDNAVTCVESKKGEVRANVEIREGLDYHSYI